VAALVSHWFIKRREKESFQKEKLEELYRAIVDFKTILDVALLNFELYIHGKFTEKDYYESMTKGNVHRDDQTASRRVEAIIYLWFPYFSDEWRDLDKKRSGAVTMMNPRAFECADQENYAIQFRDRVNELDNKFSKILVLLSKEAKKLSKTKIV